MISIVIPALNEEEFLEDCIWSIKNQNYSGEYEIIIMDNGSDDRTQEIAKEHADKLYVEPDMSLPELRNAGIKRAEGEIIASTDADCLMDENWLKEAEKSLKNGNVLVTGPITSIKNKELFQVLLYLYNIWLQISMNSLGFSHASAGNCAFYRKEALEIGGFKHFFPSDGKFGLDMSKKGSLRFNPDMLVFASMRRYEKDPIVNTSWELVLSHIRLRYGKKKEFHKSYYWREKDKSELTPTEPEEETNTSPTA